jgi:hypothetical protein
VSFFIEVEQRYVTKLFVEEGMQGVEIIDGPNKRCHGDAFSERKLITGSKR